MTASSLVSARLWKEFRGLSPAWLACLASVLVAAGLGGRSQALGLIAYFLGAVAVGALSMGHEYNGRTLTMLLSQPVRRERLFLEKLGVLAAVLLVLSAVVWVGLFDTTDLEVLTGDMRSVMWSRSVQSARNWRVLAVGLPLLCGLFVAPWLTMVCRNALAGMVFAAAVPATMWIAGDITSATIYGGDLSATIEARDFAREIFWRGTVVAGVMAAAASWWMFMRLEAIDGRGLEVRLPSWLSSRAGSRAAAPAFARRHAIWLLVKKELRLQQLTFAVAVLYAVSWFGIWLFRESFPLHQVTLLSALTVFHGGAIVLLAGALPSAEERQLGTLEWQLLLPMAAWKQWAVKVGVALSVSIVLALGLPTVISLISASSDIRRELHTYQSPVLALAVVMATTGSLYVSSLSANGLRALLISLPAVLGVMGFAMRWVVGPLDGRSGMSRGLDLVLMPLRYPSEFGAGMIALSTLLILLLVVIYAGLLALLLRFAMANHRSTERGATRVWRQVSWMGGSLVVGFLVWAGMFVPYREGFRQLNEAANRRSMANRATAEFVIEDGGGIVAQDSIVILYYDVRYEGRAPGAPPPYYFIHANREGRFSSTFLRNREYFAVAVTRTTGSLATLELDVRRNAALLERLRQNATPLTLRPGESTTVTLKLTEVP